MTPNIVLILTKTTAPTAAAGTGDISPIFDRKIDETTIGLSSYYAKYLRSIGALNGKTIVDHIAAFRLKLAYQTTIEEHN